MITLLIMKWMLTWPSLLPAASGQYTLLSDSKVFIKGTSNVNKFTCDCEGQYPVQTYQVTFNQSTLLEFNQTILDIPVVNFNCKNRKMDRDLQAAMKAEEFPFIRLTLKTIKLIQESSDILETNDFTAQAKLDIQMAGTTRHQAIHLKIKKNNDSEYTIEGAKMIRMTDFGITPPEVLFGMIKVNDEITFHFNLKLQIK